MKLKHVRVANFKGVDWCEFSLESREGPRSLACLIGDNGSGKTTVLQAIALTISLATRRTRHVTEFNWHGFLPDRVASRGPTRVELVVALDDEEVSLTSQLFREWFDSQSTEWRQTHQVVAPSEHREVTLVYESGRVSSPQGFEALNQFLGRYYIRWLARVDPAKKDLFSKLGDVFWFDQYRNLATPMLTQNGAEGPERREVEGWNAGVAQLREYLVGWWGYYTSPSAGKGKSYVKDLEGRFAQIFPGVQFRGIMPRGDVTAPSARDFYFLLEREGRLYDLAEMSSGEQAVFALLYDFVRLGISKSVVIIDELELHLHPPGQQAILANLRKIGPDCQFLISTHSEFLTDVIPNEQEVRLKGGLRCL